MKVKMLQTFLNSLNAKVTVIYKLVNSSLLTIKSTKLDTMNVVTELVLLSAIFSFLSIELIRQFHTESQTFQTV